MFGKSRGRFDFTDQSRHVLAKAREEAIALQHGRLDTEHILLGLLSDTEIVATLQNQSIVPDEIRAAVGNRSPRGTAPPTPGEIPYTSQAKKVLELALREARERKDDWLGTEHLLVAVYRESQSVGAEVLRQVHFDPDRISSRRPRRAFAGKTQFRVWIDDASERSIYEQIIAQVTEAVATGEVSFGERLPTVRQLADELDIAPGTVARAYGELERQGVVVTEGARGTRVAARPAEPVSDPERAETLEGLLRPAAVAAFHLGGSATELRVALERAMRGIFDKNDHAA